jgi:DNA polymerase III delta subunit
MTDKELRDDLKNGRISRQYILIGDEPLLIDNAIAAIKDALKIDNPFDYESVSLPDTSVEEILPKLFVGSFLSARRLFVFRNLEELGDREIKEWHEAFNHQPLPNCVVLTHVSDKENQWRKYDAEKIASLYPSAQCVTFVLDKTRVREWIVRRDKRSGLGLSPGMIEYLEDEFESDITGLKNELEKIENFLAERKSLSAEEMKTLTSGLWDFDKYKFVNSFFYGGKDTLRQFEDSRPYIGSYAETVFILGRRLVKNAARYRDGAGISDMLDSLLTMDRKVKTSSLFMDMYLGIFLTKKWGMFKKGAAYGK